MGDEMTVLEGLLLGAIQGLTEWLPVSSSGHLVLAQEFAGIEAPLLFEASVHVGTLLVVLVFYRKQIADMLAALARAPRAWRETRSVRRVFTDDPDRWLAALVVVATVPAAVVGLVFREPIEALFGSVVGVGVALLVTGTILWTTRYSRTSRTTPRLDLKEALLIGCAQSLAILPGISRSGTTIGAATHLGVERELAVRFSFLLSVPAIVGATVLQADPSGLASASLNAPAYAAGVLAAAVVGYASLVLLVRLVRARKLHHFAWYCWALGLAALGATLAGLGGI